MSYRATHTYEYRILPYLTNLTLLRTLGTIRNSSRSILGSVFKFTILFDKGCSRQCSKMALICKYLMICIAFSQAPFTDDYRSSDYFGIASRPALAEASSPLPFSSMYLCWGNLALPAPPGRIFETHVHFRECSPSRPGAYVFWGKRTEYFQRLQVRDPDTGWQGPGNVRILHLC